MTTDLVQWEDIERFKSSILPTIQPVARIGVLRELWRGLFGYDDVNELQKEAARERALTLIIAGKRQTAQAIQDYGRTLERLKRIRELIAQDKVQDDTRLEQLQADYERVKRERERSTMSIADRMAANMSELKDALNAYQGMLQDIERSPSREDDKEKMKTMAKAVYDQATLEISGVRT